MSRLPVDEARVVRVFEDSQMIVGETREFIAKDLRLVRFLGGLRQARRAGIANAQGLVEEARGHLRAAEAALAEAERHDAQCEEIEVRIVQDFGLEQRMLDEASRTISIDIKAAVGFKHTRPELTDCSSAEKERV